MKHEARTFQEMFGNGGEDRRPNPPAKPKKKAAAKKGSAKAKRGASVKSPAVKAKPKAKPAKKAAAKAKTPKRAPKSARKSARKSSMSCGPKGRRCLPEGDRFIERDMGEAMGLFDRHAGGFGKPSSDGSRAHRGRFVKRGDLMCGTERGPGVGPMKELLMDMDLPEAKRRRVGKFFDVWLDPKGGQWMVYDLRSATLLGTTFKSPSLAAAWIKRGSAKRNTCPRPDGVEPRRRPSAEGYVPPGERNAEIRARRDEERAEADRERERQGGVGFTIPSMGVRSNPSGRYVSGTVEGEGRSVSASQRLDRIETRVDRLEVRVTRTELGLAQGLNVLAGRRASSLGGSGGARQLH